MQKVISDIELLQKNDRASVLVLGESGTGKELVARAIHSGGARVSGAFVPINCSAIPDNLAESQLFGHVKGAFTGASSDKKGAFELAHKGTLFLDEIGDMLPTIQAKLLRVLEDGMVEPVGATKRREVDVRTIAATNADLREKIEAGAFRRDLFHRLAAFTVTLPPLRDRREDIPPLVRHFVTTLSSEMGVKEHEVGGDFMETFESYTFPGNVRELRNMVEQALIRAAGKPLERRHVTLSGLGSAEASSGGHEIHSPGPTEMPLDLKEVEKITIRRAMTAADGNVSEAAKLLGIGRTKLYRALPSI
jgi:transcriptional regulator with PAS, ATPase and Fis domain